VLAGFERGGIDRPSRVDSMHVDGAGSAVVTVCCRGQRPLVSALDDGRLPAVLVQQDRQNEDRGDREQHDDDRPNDPRPHLALRLAHD
jgi:hypothetical protein